MERDGKNSETVLMAVSLVRAEACIGAFRAQLNSVSKLFNPNAHLKALNAGLTKLI